MMRNRRMAMPEIIPQEIIPQTQDGVSGGAILLFVLIFILLCGGGGFLVWWFFIRCPTDCEKNDDCCEGHECNGSKCCGLNNYECSDNEDCCGNYCHEGKCASEPCKKINEVCATDQRCCDDLMCINSKCSNCKNIDTSCDNDNHCCDDLMCINSKCSNCNDEGETCSSNNHCCDDLNCRDGKCSSCKSNDESCTEDSECCTNECKEGKCFIDEDTCKNLNEACTGSNCCEGLECEDSICSEPPPPPPPTPPPSTCDFGYALVNGVCTVQCGGTNGPDKGATCQGVYNVNEDNMHTNNSNCCNACTGWLGNGYKCCSQACAGRGHGCDGDGCSCVDRELKCGKVRTNFTLDNLWKEWQISKSE